MSNVLSPNWYPNYDHPDADSLDWNALVAYLVKNSGLPQPHLVTPKMYGTNADAPTELVFESGPSSQAGQNDADLGIDKGNIILLDAVMAWNNPENSLARLLYSIGKVSRAVIEGTEQPNIPKFVKPSTLIHVPPPAPPPVQGPANPIGDPLRPEAPGWFKRAKGDTHEVGKRWTAPDGHVYYLENTITDGPVWYQLS